MKSIVVLALFLALASHALAEEGSKDKSLSGALSKISERLQGLKKDLKELKDVAGDHVSEKTEAAKKSVQEDIDKLEKKSEELEEKVKSYKESSRESLKDFRSRLDLALDDLEKAMGRFKTKSPAKK